MTTLKNLFAKPVDRPIEGVIKADDEASLRLEIEEYVLTNEAKKRLESFLDTYNNSQGANGVWVSGFFGSGKSHLLKILALLLENRQISNTTTFDLFLPKCGDNEIFRADLKCAVAIPSQSILFNIDQKADVISKTQIDALLAVFMKVFDEMCGYYGKQGHIAKFERDLDSRGIYEQFKSAYESSAGITWHQGREQALLEASNIATAYSKVTSSDEFASNGILDKYRNEYHVSIEDFAEQVNAYIEKQVPKFRLNFFVDEVGQYIAGDVKLMTNLQTIAESLATKCRGRAWIIVTAQEDMDTVVGESSKQQGNDFSKIQARFANRMKLTSANVDEVIQKRLLTKTEEGVELLSGLYHTHENNFKTMFDFADGSQTYRNFKDRDHFIHSYPFIPYQFTLFQSSIQNLSQHNAFEGKHSSVGERSMLGVFQQVTIRIGDHKIGQLATFDLMFEGIRTALKSNVQRAIIQAENNLDDHFAVQLLKALFLVKYVKEFKPTVQNLCILMLDHFDQDMSVLKKQVERALNRLELETYIQRNGELYEYLTDEEQDIEQEIKNTEVESSDVAAEIEKIIFYDIIKNRKIRCSDNEQDYPFSRKLDDRLYGREQELTIHVVTPFYENTGNEHLLRMHNMGRDELMIVMPNDERFVHDILIYKRTEKYIRQNVSITQREAVKRILNDKSSQNQERYAELRQCLQKLISNAKMFINGADIEISSKDAQTRVQHGFNELVVRTYPNLLMLRGFSYSENDIVKYLKNSQQSLFGSDATVMAESEQEILSFIQSNGRGGIRTTIKLLLERFEHKPYGWYYAAILCTLAKLLARGKVEVRLDGNLLDEDDLEPALRNSHAHGNVVLSPQVEFTASQVRALKDFFGDFFDSPPSDNEAKALGKETDAQFQKLIVKLDEYTAQTTQYPFLNTLTPVFDKLKEFAGKPYTWYLTELVSFENTLLDMKEGLIDPIRKFMSGSQKDIFRNAHAFIQTQKANFAYIEGDETSLIDAGLNDPECFKGNCMQQVKIQVEKLQEKIEAQLKTEIAKAKEVVETLQERLCDMAEFNALSPQQQEQLVRPFHDFNVSVAQQQLIAVIRDSLRQFEENDYKNLLSQMATWVQPAKPVITESTPVDNTNKVAEEVVSLPVANPELRVVSQGSIKIAFQKAWLADETDVEQYLESMREAFLEEIKKGKRIQI